MQNAPASLLKYGQSVVVTVNGKQLHGLVTYIWVSQKGNVMVSATVTTPKGLSYGVQVPARNVRLG